MKRPGCCGALIRVGERAWCIQRYDAGGCGADFVVRGTRLVRQP